MSPYFFVFLLFLHLVADFFLQTRKMSIEKSKKIGWLVRHMSVHVLVFCVGLFFFTSMTLVQVLAVAFLNAGLHGLVDWNIWNGYRRFIVKYQLQPGKKFKYWEDKLFYTTIGIDQFLHLSLLTLCCVFAKAWL